VEGATVTLSHEGKVVATVETDAFGEFRFNALEAARKIYLVTITSLPRDEIIEKILVERSCTLTPIRTDTN
jgi:broad-specificity NMP kinase